MIKKLAKIIQIHIKKGVSQNGFFLIIAAPLLTFVKCLTTASSIIKVFSEIKLPKS